MLAQSEAFSVSPAYQASQNLKLQPLSPPIQFLGMTIYTAVVTPAQMQQFLDEAQGCNIRNTSRVVLRRYTNEMSNGEWTPDALDPIVFNRDGKMINFAHRGHAMILANLSMPVLVVENMKESAIQNMDRGASRTNAHYINNLKGGTVGPVLSSVIGRLWRHEHFPATSAWGRLSEKASPSPSTTIKLYRDNELELDKAVDIAKDARGSGIQTGILAYCIFEGMRQANLTDYAIAREFARGIITGEMLERNDPRMMYRNRLLARDIKTAKLTANDQMACMIKAWNAYINGKKIGLLRFAPTETWPEFSTTATI